MRCGVAVWLISASGCTLLPLSGISAGGCNAQLLATTEPTGERCISAVMEGVPAVAQWINAEGVPDYVEAPSSGAVRLVYIDSDQVITFSRNLVGTPTPMVSPRIRASDHTRFLELDKQRLIQVRGGTGIQRNAEPEEAPPTGIIRRRVGQDE